MNNNNNTTNNNSDNSDDDNNNDFYAVLESLQTELVVAKRSLVNVEKIIQSLQGQWEGEDAATRHAIMDRMKLWVPDRTALNTDIAALRYRLTALENPQPRRGMWISFLSLLCLVWVDTDVCDRLQLSLLNITGCHSGGTTLSTKDLRGRMVSGN